MAVLLAHLLGGLALTWDETPLPAIPGVTARSLLAYLLTHRDRPHTRDFLAGTFWPDRSEAVARRCLSQVPWQIHRALSPHPALLTEGDMVQFDPELPLGLDVKEFTGQNAQCTSEGQQVLEHCDMVPLNPDALHRS